MPEATVTSKGSDGVVEMRPATVDLRDLVGMCKPKRKGVTVEAMNVAIRKAASRP